MIESNHRSFHLTPPPYMRGKRIKPHLLVLEYITAALAIVTAILSAIAVILFLSAPLGAPLQNSLWGSLLFFGSPPLTARLVILTLKVCYRKLGLMTEEEARDFYFRGRKPDSWLEPINGDVGASAQGNFTTNEKEDKFPKSNGKSDVD